MSENDTNETQALTVREDPGMRAMAMLPEPEFRQRLAALKTGQQRLDIVKRELMAADRHYGVIPGTKKPTLLKPGAELLCQIYGLRPDFAPTVRYGDGHAVPAVAVTMRCELHLGDLAGPVVAVGYGAANSHETRHRYRRGERTCPQCGTVGSVIKGKAEYGGGWLCWNRKGGCGAKFQEGDQAIEGQVVGNIENEDPYDLENTLIKMAKKRALIDATLTATASSDLFTQDMEDHPPEAPEPSEKPSGKAEPKKSGRQPQRDPAAVEAIRPELTPDECAEIGDRTTEQMHEDIAAWSQELPPGSIADNSRFSGASWKYRNDPRLTDEWVAYTWIRMRRAVGDPLPEKE